MPSLTLRFGPDRGRASRALESRAPMGWSVLATQFCFELAFGVLFALAFVPRAPVGGLFYRILGTTAVTPALVALVASVATGALDAADPIVLAGLLTVVAYPVYSGPLRGARWAAGLVLGALGAAGAVVLCLRAGQPGLGAAGLVLASASALATGAVAGSVGLAMVLGHWYLTVPNLGEQHLRRLNHVTIATLASSLVLVGLSCLSFAELLNQSERPLFGPTGLFHLGTRIAVGLVFPLGFAWMTASSLRFHNTRSATGILYASTVLVLIGTAVSLALQDSYGIPL